MTAIAEIELPTKEVADEARGALRSLTDLVRSHAFDDVRLSAHRAEKSVDVTIPRAAYQLFLELLGHLANGNAVTVVPIHAELTTQEAAELLNVSRPHLIGLLERGELSHRKVGSHRRVLAKDLFEYKAKQRAQGEARLKELAELSQDMGLYD